MQVVENRWEVNREERAIHSSYISGLMCIYDSVENHDSISPSKVLVGLELEGKLPYFSRNLRSAQKIFHGVSDGFCAR